MVANGMGFHPKPYQEQEPGVFRFQAARSALSWVPDIEAYLVEQEMTTDLAPTVAKLMDASGQSMQSVVASLKAVLEAFE